MAKGMGEREADNPRPRRVVAHVMPPRDKDMSWQQKCRISALRAACASSYDLRYVQAEGETLINSESDEDVTKRILARAESFRVALLGDGALDARYHGQEALGPEYNAGDAATCIHCMTAIHLIYLVDMGVNKYQRWVDRHGYSSCRNLGVQFHTPDQEPPPESNVCPGCGSKSKSVHRATVVLPSAPTLYCDHKWHDEL